MNESPVGLAVSEIESTTIEASHPYIGNWNVLVSTTNWEKGRIIAHWREAMIEQGLAISQYSDDAWSRLVSGITGQHAGRLRRVFIRFGELHSQYPGLYWSHFQATLDWHDAEMWLEGAVQNDWSVGEMRRQRWQTLGAVAKDQPQAEDEIVAEKDEDFEPAKEAAPNSLTGRYEEVQGPRLSEGPDFGDAGDDDTESSSRERSEDPSEYSPSHDRSEPVRPFANLPSLPDDVADAFENFKLVVLRHKSEGWSDISRDDMLAALDSLKQLALAPNVEAPF